MKRVKSAAKWLSITLLTLLVVLVALGIQTWYFKPLSIDWFYARVFATHALQSPETLSSLGMLPPALDFHSDKLDDVSDAHERAVEAQVRDALATLKRYDRSGLDLDGRLSYDTLAYYLKMEAENAPYRLHTFPVNQLFGVQTTTVGFMVDTHYIASADDARNYIARLDQIPRKFAQVQDGLRAREAKGVLPPRFAVEKSLLQLRAFNDKPVKENPLYVDLRAKLDKLPAGELSAAQRNELLAQAERALAERVLPAWRKLTDYVAALLPKAKTNDGAWSLPDGDKYYAYLVRKSTTTDMTPQQVHELGLEEVARISTEMNEILEQQGLRGGSIGSRVQQLSQDPKQRFGDTPEDKKAMLARYQEIIDEINKGIGDAFDLRPKGGVEVRPVPELAQASAPAAYYMEGAMGGSRPGVFFANMRAPGDVPKFSMRTTAYHEAIPGHHFQVTIAHELEGLPFFRRVIPFGAYEEGWALYGERLAYEMGFGLEALDRLGRLRDEMMRASRLVVDTGVHYKRWTREQAISYMMDNTGYSEGEATSEIERYIVTPGQALAYKVGMLKILALREHAKKNLGAKFDLKQFHNEVLVHGALPLTLLEGVINDWVIRRKKEAA